MKKYVKTLLGILLLLFLPLALGIGIARAQEFKSGDHVTVAQNQTINSTLWSAGKNVDIAGTINGDVFCAGQSVDISATVNGDVICAGQDVRISGPVSGDVRVAGQTVSVSSKVDGSLTIGAQTFSLDQTASVGRDATVGATDVTINGKVSRDFVGGGTTITVSNSIGRNVKVGVNKLTLTSAAKIGGSLDYTSKNNAFIAQGATVAGTTHRSEPAKHQNKVAWTGARWIFGLYVLVSLLIIALVAVLFFPRLLAAITDEALARPWKTLLVGLIAGLLFPVLFIALLLTVVAIPLALLLLCIWMLIVAFGGLFFSFYIGRLILRGPHNAIWVMLLGGLIVLVALQVPILGIIVWLVGGWMGSGMVLLDIAHRYERPHYTLAEPRKTR